MINEKINNNINKKENILHLKLNKNNFNHKNKDIFWKLKKYINKREINKLNIYEISDEKNKSDKKFNFLTINNDNYNNDLNKNNNNELAINNINNKKGIKINKIGNYP